MGLNTYVIVNNSVNPVGSCCGVNWLNQLAYQPWTKFSYVAKVKVALEMGE